MRVAVVSSIMGFYDQPAAPVEQTVACDWVMVTDAEVARWPWKPVVESRRGVPPRLAAKVAKCRPDHYTDADVTVWVDGHVRITHPGFIAWAIAPLEQGADLAQLRHPFHARLTHEAALSATLPKYAGQPVREQVASYLEGGHPDGWGLWAAGIIARRTSAVGMAEFGDAWLAEQVRWSVQDQLSEAPLLRRFGLRPADLEGPLLGHWAFDLGVHADGTQ